ncbi:MAG: ABC transporter ATP-binding protein/permease [Ruminococcus flavefaciens]|nr:ABC transporter ATP-binding protein/permease [Ruminococcus flavefaciens]
MEKGMVRKGFFGYLHYIWKDKKSIYLLVLLFFPAYIAASYLQVYLPKAVLQELQEGQRISHFGKVMLVLVLVLAAGIYIRALALNRIQKYMMLVRHKLQNEYAKKLLYVDYRYLEDPEFLEMRNKAKESLFQGKVGDVEVTAWLDAFLNELIKVIAQLGMLFIYAWYLCLLTPWLLLPLLLIPFFVQMINKILTKNENRYAKQYAAGWQKLNYATEWSGDFSKAKDIRLYHMKPWLSGMIEKLCTERRKYKAGELRSEAFAESIYTVSFSVYYGILFAVILYRFWQGNIDISDVVFYAGMGEAVYNLVLGGVLREIKTVSRISLAFARFQNFMAYGEDSAKEECPTVQEAPEIRIENLSYAYPVAENPVLENFNLTVKAGEKLAVVGVNGAGKTTLMKLVCGLLHPTKGRILINGKDMEEMRAEERYAYFSCAFQDIHFLPVTLLENISMKPERDSDTGRVWECLNQAGMKETVMQLPEQLQSYMEKNLQETAVDFSGGQRQKLLLARALYRKTGALILDEPTSALDALAENEIYEKYSDFTEQKTSFFVSHRLASTRFCDRIILIDGGRIAEEGTHEELLEQKGLYAKMFELQSKYYKEETA